MFIPWDNALFDWLRATSAHSQQSVQRGPIYFKTPRKCGIFGMICEAIPRQVNYLIDEASNVGKGANSTISYVHHYFENHGLEETHAHLYADNCSAQNKNNTFLWYLAWRIIKELHKHISYSFLIAGHTKFAPDRCFGIIKKCYKVNSVSSLLRICRDGWGIKHDWNEQSPVGRNSRQQSHRTSLWLDVTSWTIF